ncbi:MULTISPECIES: ABC transporter ATP-binding protein [Polaromonas]|uniref:ABC transporter ATP-binding protein n=1 Tax=Polaromonas aquatica TaxID=332657 RepID=A0ABW1U7G3_9BURK
MNRPMLKISGLQAWYGESHVLHGVDLTVKEGETVTLLGRNGAGKTTTLKSIVGVVRERQGSIMFDGRDLMTLPLHHVARQGIGFVPEDRGIYSSLSVMENLMLPPKFTPGGLSVSEIFNLFPNLEERRNSQGTKLSGGEQQMLAIARILRTGARFLILDEPTEGLSPVIVQRIGEILKLLRERGMTILLVEQNFRFAQKLADRFYVMEDGHIVDTFSASELDSRLHGLQAMLGV